MSAIIKICPHGFKSSNCEICEAKYQKEYHKKYKTIRKEYPHSSIRTIPEIWNTAIIKKYLEYYDKNNIITKYVLLDARKPE